MKNVDCLLTVLMILPATAGACGQQSPQYFQDKIGSIEYEISLARQHHNQHRIDGLKQALADIQRQCSRSRVSHAALHPGSP